MRVANDFIKNNQNRWIDKEDLGLIIEGVVDELQEGILNIFSTYVN